MKKKSKPERRQKGPADAAELRRHAEAMLRGRQRNQRFEVGDPRLEADPRRLLHELQVHQVELEMQNEELQDARAGWKLCWKNTPTSTILRRPAISPWMNRAGFWR